MAQQRDEIKTLPESRSLSLQDLLKLPYILLYIYRDIDVASPMHILMQNINSYFHLL